MDLDKSGDHEILTSILKSNLGTKAREDRDETAEARPAQGLPRGGQARDQLGGQVSSR